MFDRFVRLNNARSRDGDGTGTGTGLGLAIARDIIATHGASVHIRLRS